MKPSKVFLKAAQRIDAGKRSTDHCTHSCCAVGIESGLLGSVRLSHKNVEWYGETFAHTYYSIDELSVTNAAEEIGISADKFRVMLLCMASAVAKTELDGKK